MANPTTNYGFVLPTSSDLVTDLPADFDVALQGVDTRLKALNPETTLGDIAYRSATANTNTRLPIGTTGQVLAVVGGVPAWATTADQTPLTTKGDLFTFDTADARLGVGANGTVLTADSAEATGLKWASPASTSPDYQLINAGGTALTGAATITVSGISGKNNLMIVVQGASSVNASPYVSFRFNSDSTNGNYQYTYFGATNTTTNFTGYTSTTEVFTSRAGNAAADTVNSYLQVLGANATGLKTVWGIGAGTGATTPQTWVVNGVYKGTSAITSVSILSDSGNFDAGTIFVYGA